MTKKCPHGKREYFCKECGGLGLCKHGRQGGHCPGCDDVKKTILVKCAVEGCPNQATKNRGNTKYCRKCAKNQMYLRQFEWEQRQILKNPEGRRRYHRERQRPWRAKIKRQTLTLYGKNGKLQCCWRNCAVSDLDMLSLDHLNNGGKEERKQSPGGGHTWYMRLKKQGYPPGYQTLCLNHQFKKEIIRRRKVYLG